MMNNDQETVVVIGGGPVGAMMATFLANQGFTVTLYEKRADLRKHNLSAGRSINLALANRGIDALAKLGLMNQVKQLMIPMAGRMVHHPNGNTQFQAYGQQPHEVIYSISRAELNRLLLNTAEATGKVSLHFNYQCQQVDWDSNQIVIRSMQTKADQCIRFDRLIGADGAGSVIRQALIDRCTGHDEYQPLGHSYKELTIPAGPGGQFRLTAEALHIWPRGGYMMIALPNQDGSFTVTLFLPNEGPNSFATLNSSEKVQCFFAEQFPDALPLLPALCEDFFSNPTGHLGTVRCAPWHFQDKGVLIGDAAHAIVPFHGQGMNCGFEDCAALASCVNQFNNWSDCLIEYNARRFLNGNAIADMAIENYVEMRDSVLDPHFLLKKAIGFRLEQEYPNHFIPRYSMVMFHRIPYVNAQRRGRINEAILDQLAQGISHIDELDWVLADHLVRSQLNKIGDINRTTDG
ncbi:FAD-dependent oxidoreductase [Spartinivicinus poritis]|uniref:Kynurenine 3-monooxygenase n=1 Tax=Spartinivicinus poritis TaxID=2994640 RepID=A0ABT5U5W2_9GAMM|nr:NAD(P)/FAD-dependent oxidoreductase [Spartinivicinus sp. A2-2]MDE1460858.1 NAD(P)/FAD-dependent oxidoreductase [Spartinivicinus sp. A2-2]